jgi:DNA-binding NarL/FixJ family response regulator
MAQAELLLPKNLSNAAEFASVPLAATLHVGDSRAPARVFESRRDLWPAGLSRGVVATDGTLPLTHVWESICSRRRRIRDAFCTEDSCHFLLETGSGLPLSARQVQILDRVLAGHTQQELCVEHKLCAATVSQAVSKTLHMIGLECRVASVPALLVMVAHAARRGLSLTAHVAEVEIDGVKVQLVRADRPDRELDPRLSSAEQTVLRLIVEGLSNAEIGARRHTSTGTVANQAGAIFRKLQVSGRGELLARLVREALG